MAQAERQPESAAASGTKRARILISETSELVRLGLSDVIKADPAFSIAAVAGWPQDLPDACARLQPDVTLVGVPEEPGAARDVTLEAIRRTRRQFPNGLFIALIDGRHPRDIFDAVRAGANAVLSRGSPASVLAGALHDVLAGKAALDPDLARVLFEHMRAEQPASARDEGQSMYPLSRREVQVLQALADGLRGRELEARLGVTAGTIKTHVRHILRKLDAPDRMSAVLKAQRAHLLDVA